MTIRKCPHCAQFTHLDDGGRAPLFCWSCAARVDFGRLQTPEARLIARATATCDRALPNPSRLVRAGKIALVMAVPFVALMPLVCNGFDIFVVRNALAPFVMR